MAYRLFRKALVNLVGGLNDSMPPYGINERQCAAMKNMRVWRGEARTCKGYLSSTSSVIRTGVTTIQGLGFGIRADGTEDLIGASDSGYWRIVGDAKSLIATSKSRGLITTVSGTVVTGDVDCRFNADYAPGDQFWMTTDGIAEMKPVLSIQHASAMTLSASYAGATTAGEHDGWWRVADAKTRMAFWDNRWFFANTTDQLHEWDGTTFRETGMQQAPSQMATTAVASGGALSAEAWYRYRWALADSRGRDGLMQGGDGYVMQLPATGTSMQFLAHDAGSNTSAAAFEACKTVPGRFPVDLASILVFRSGPHVAEEDTVSAAQTYLTAFLASVSAWLDDGSITPATSAAPAYNFEPDAGYEDLAVIENRLAAISGRELFISGLPPTDAYTDTAGRNEPEYWSVTHRIGDGEEIGQYGFLSIRTRMFILGSRDMHIVDVRADDPAVWGVIPFMPNYGCVSRWSIANGGDRAYWLGKKGGRLTVLAFDGLSAPQDIGAPIDGTLSAVDSSKYTECVAGVGHGFYWITLPITGGTYKTMEFNIRAGTWCHRDWQVQAYAQAETDVYAGFGDGLINKLENGLSKAGAAQSYQLDTQAVGEIPEWLNIFQSVQGEFDVYAGSPVVSAQYIVDERAAVALPNSPVALTATPDFRTHQTCSAQGRREQIRLLSQGTDVDFAVRMLVIKGQSEQRDGD